jgi:beta-glucanase (GH16 family)
VYKTKWDAKQIQFYIDDALVYTFSPEIKNENTWPFNKPFYLILNLAIGGSFGGPEVDDSIFPEKFCIDYVRVYQ